MAKKKDFSNPTNVEKRTGFHLLVGSEEENKDKKEVDVPVEEEYTTSNVRVRKDLRTKIYMLRAKSGMTLQDTFSEIFEYYFKNNPL